MKNIVYAAIAIFLVLLLGILGITLSRLNEQKNAFSSKADPVETIPAVTKSIWDVIEEQQPQTTIPEPMMTDENGNLVTDENGNPIPLQTGDTTETQVVSGTDVPGAETDIPDSTESAASETVTTAPPQTVPQLLQTTTKDVLVIPMID